MPFSTLRMRLSFGKGLSIGDNSSANHLMVHRYSATGLLPQEMPESVSLMPMILAHDLLVYKFAKFSHTTLDVLLDNTGGLTSSDKGASMALSKSLSCRIHTVQAGFGMVLSFS